MPNLITYHNKHLYLSGVWLDVDLRADAEKACLKEIEQLAQTLLTITVNIMALALNFRYF